LPLESESVDRALVVTVLPEISDQSRALAELWRVLKPGGFHVSTAAYPRISGPTPRRYLEAVS